MRFEADGCEASVQDRTAGAPDGRFRSRTDGSGLKGRPKERARRGARLRAPCAFSEFFYGVRIPCP